MAQLDAPPPESQAQDRPFPPGRYPVVVIGSGPGGLQTSYSLRRLGVEHAVLSADDAPGGMFQRFPIFQRLVTWTKRHAPVGRDDEAYDWYDWNSLLSDDRAASGLVADAMTGPSYFPARSEMEDGLRAFVDRTGVRVRYGCRWEATRRDGDGFVVTTTDGDYACRVLVVAVGMAQPWKPATIPGIEDVPHYVDVRPVETYADARVFLIGKRNSGFELADGLLGWARQIIIASPRPARISVIARSTASARARYLQPYEDHVLGGGHVVLDCAIDRVDKTDDGFRVTASGTTRPGSLQFDVDEVIAATGFTVPLGDLRDVGVTTFNQDRLPTQTAFWESATVPGIHFAGAITQGSIGLKKYGNPSNSAAVHGFRYNAHVLARHIAATYFDIQPPRSAIAPDELTRFLLDRATRDGALWNQQSYLARAVEFGASGPEDVGLVPLAHFVDTAGPDAVAIAVETDAEGDIHPALYVRREQQVDEHLLPSDPLHDFTTAAHEAMLDSTLAEMTP